MKLRLKNSGWEDMVWRLVFRHGFWFMFTFCFALLFLFASGFFTDGKAGLRRIFGSVIVGYIAVCMALLGSMAVRIAIGEFREWHARRSVWALVFPSIFGGVLLSGSVWIFWRIFAP